MSEKKCSGCRKDLPIKNFYKNRNMSDGHSSYCIDCTRENSRRYFQRKKEKISKNENDSLLKAVIMSNLTTTESANAENLMKILMIEKMLKNIETELNYLKNNYVKSDVVTL
jgi:hypothetical protein